MVWTNEGKWDMMLSITKKIENNIRTLTEGIIMAGKEIVRML